MKAKDWTGNELQRLRVLLLDDNLTCWQAAMVLGRSERAVMLKANKSGITKLRDQPRWKKPAPPPPPKRAAPAPQKPQFERGFPKKKPCLGGCGRTVTLESRNDRRKCQYCHDNHADLSHLEGVAA